MDSERPIAKEIAQAEGVPTLVPDDPEDTIQVDGPRTWTDREAVDHFGFIPEGVTVKRHGDRFPAWRYR